MSSMAKTTWIVMMRVLTSFPRPMRPKKMTIMINGSVGGDGVKRKKDDLRPPQTTNLTRLRDQIV